MYVWAANWLARVDVSAPKVEALLKKPAGVAVGAGTDKAVGKKSALKRKRGEGDEAFGIVMKFRPLLMVDFCAPSSDGQTEEQGKGEGGVEMVVVERLLVDLLATLPPAYLKPKYGAS